MKQLVALRRATIALLLISLALGALALRNMSSTRQRSEQIDSAITNYALAIRSLQLDLLDERAGIVRNYDPVNSDLALAQGSLDTLKKSNLDPNSKKILDKIIVSDVSQDALVEQFNSDNALLQTLLAYITDHATSNAGAQTLLNKTLKLTLDTSPKTVREARTALGKMRASGERGASARLFSYAGLLIEVLPEIDRLLSSIREVKLESRIGDLQLAAHADSLRQSAWLQKLELSWTASTILFIMTSAMFLLVQRLHTRELQARAANERLSAAIAIPLIDTGPGTFRARVQEAADRLALHIGARRLQIAVPGVTDCLQFSKLDALPADWLAKLVDAASDDEVWSDNKVIASRAEARARGALIRAMDEAGVRELVLLRTAEPFRVMIGFEPEDFVNAQRSDYLAGISSALIAIAHSARREVMQLERERLEQSLAEKRRMANLGAIASGVAHNFNNIIGAISGFAEIGHARSRGNLAVQESLSEIQGSVERARELIDDILSFAKRRRMSTKASVNLDDLLDETVRMLSASSRDDMAFSLRRAVNSQVIYGSRGDLQQVLLNIGNNAVHVSKGRRVEIDVFRREIRDKCQMSHGDLYGGRYAVVAVTDFGDGIPEDQYQRLFEPFFTTKSGGTGLGLSTAWEIVQQHGGTIDVRSAKGGGSKFSVYLPEISAKSGVSDGNGARVLIVSDRDHLSSDEDMLAELGYEPVGIFIEDEREKMLGAIKNVDAILISTWQSWKANEIVRLMSNRLKGRPILTAYVKDSAWSSLIGVLSLSYPLRADQVSMVLSQAISGSRVPKRRMLKGIR